MMKSRKKGLEKRLFGPKGNNFWKAVAARGVGGTAIARHDGEGADDEEQGGFVKTKA